MLSKNRAEIYAEEFEEGVRLSYEFTTYLIECAEILQAKGRHSPARALAIHAEEELGKALMLLDEIRDLRPWITENRWEDEYRDHEHKARRARLGIQKNIVKITEWKTRIGPGTPKVVTEGEQMKRYAEYDIERKYRSLYVDHDLVHGRRE